MEITPFVPSGALPLSTGIVLSVGICGLLGAGLASLLTAMYWGRAELKRSKKPSNSPVGLVVGAAFGIPLACAVYTFGGIPNDAVAAQTHYSSEAARATAFYELPEEATIFYRAYAPEAANSLDSASFDSEGLTGNLGYALGAPGKLIPIGTALEEEAGQAFVSEYFMRYSEGKLEVLREDAARKLVLLEPPAPAALPETVSSTS